MTTNILLSLENLSTFPATNAKGNIEMKAKMPYKIIAISGGLLYTGLRHIFANPFT
jgi:hypothetical protein